MNQILRRLFIFRRQVITLWHAFWHPATPFYLKAIMVAVVLYVVSPIDLMPDFLLGFGMIDDVLLLAFAVNWLVKRLPREVFAERPPDREPDNANQRDFSQDDLSNDPDHKTIDGTSRRL